MTEHSLSYNFQAFHAPIRIYSSYRLLLSLIFLGIAIQGHINQPLFPLNTALTISLIYCILATGFFVGALSKSLPILRHTFIGFVVDIFFIALLEYTVVQQNITLDLILVVAIAAGSIVFTGRLGTALAAIATIFLCSKAFFLDGLFLGKSSDTLHTALLGITFFATSWITQTVARRLKESENITQRQAKDINELQKLNQAIVERMHTGVTVFNKALELEMMNEAARRLLSTDPSIAVDPAYGIELIHSSINAWLADTATKANLQLSAQSPELKLGFTFLGDEKRIVVFIEDSSKIKQHAQQLKLASLGQLAASIAHEIRNPLAAVSYSSQLLQETKPSDEQSRLLVILRKHITRMNDIVNNVLQISSREPPEIKSINLSQWIHHFLESSFSTAQNSVIDYDISTSIFIDFDPSHLAQVMTNLIENALHSVEKNTSENTDQNQKLIFLKSNYIPTLHRPDLTIRDTGSGIPEQSIPHIFEPFFTTSKVGSGLGLFLCREICELNHARIHMLPAQQGACFQILFKPRSPNG